MKRSLSLFVVVALVGCGSVETKEEKKDPVVSTMAQDAPPAEENAPPPFGMPKQKVSPSSLDKPTDSLTHDTKPH